MLQVRVLRLAVLIAGTAIAVPAPAASLAVVANYRDEGVLAWIEGDGPRPALCFRLAHSPASRERNEDYARQLRDTLARLGFPPDTIAADAGTADID
jgi:hypothetical protein